MVDLERRLREFCDGLDGSLDPVAQDEVLTERVGDGDVRPLQDRRPGWRRPAWAVASAAVVAAGVLIALVWFLAANGDRSPAADEGPMVTAPVPPSATTSSVAPDEVSGLEVPPTTPIVVATPLGVTEWSFTVLDDPVETDDVPARREEPAVLHPNDPAVRVLAGGRDWEGAIVQPPVHEAVGVAVYDGVVYVAANLGATLEGEIVDDPLVWASSDLEQWNRVSVAPAPGGDPELEGSVAFAGITASDAGLVLSGRTGHAWALVDGEFVLSELSPIDADCVEESSDPCAPPIWAVADGFVTRSAELTSVGGHVFSADGIHWERIDAGAGDRAAIAAVARGPDGYLGLSPVAPAVLSSPDGITWEAIADRGPWWSRTEPDRIRETGLIAFGGGWIVADLRGWAGASVSAAGAEWQQLPRELTETWSGTPRPIDQRTLEIDGCFGMGCSGWFPDAERWTGIWTVRILDD